MMNEYRDTNIRSILLLLLFAYSNAATAQILNWESLIGRQIINANTGINSSLSYGLGYSYKLRTTLPLVLGGNISIPAGKNIFDDFRTDLGGHVLLLDKLNFKTSASLFGIYRRYQTNLVSLQNVGTYLKSSFGYYRTTWFGAAEIAFDKAVVTHHKHTQKFKDEVYGDVADGWYKSVGSGNILYGLQAGLSRNKYDLTLNFGKISNLKFETQPMLPFYFNIGLNYKGF